MSKWALETGPEWIPVPVDPKRYKEIIAEVAEILYFYSSQLGKNSLAHPLGRNSHSATLEEKSKENRR